MEGKASVEEIAISSAPKRKIRTFKFKPEEMEVVEDVFCGKNMQQVLISKFNVDITRKELQCLAPGKWLNDEVSTVWLDILIFMCRKPRVHLYGL